MIVEKYQKSYIFHPYNVFTVEQSEYIFHRFPTHHELDSPQ